jgi:hypothetical protein
MKHSFLLNFVHEILMSLIRANRECNTNLILSRACFGNDENYYKEM